MEHIKISVHNIKLRCNNIRKNTRFVYKQSITIANWSIHCIFTLKIKMTAIATTNKGNFISKMLNRKLLSYNRTIKVINSKQQIIIMIMWLLAVL